VGIKVMPTLFWLFGFRRFDCSKVSAANRPSQLQIPTVVGY